MSNKVVIKGWVEKPRLDLYLLTNAYGYIHVVNTPSGLRDPQPITITVEWEDE